ncbi:hypothetical protein Clacol_002581 [Clathrus columnatus]|uniref:ABC transporter domain-containing protein n=1 Tax=Clathrus columnatus TaxID=1419009 RepID=A0AAV5A4J2_9AGAM|nr:hypothetical protein Clacol_002581 [Clathrus columnatus]
MSLVCQTDQACANFPLRELPETGPFVSDNEHNMTCYRDGETIIENHQMCDVTNIKILEMLKERKPQVTFSCDKKASTCRFQFWVQEVESFYCALDTCDIGSKPQYDKNITEYTCQNLQCRCVPGRMLCGEAGSINIDEFLEQEIKGPGRFSCTTGSGCTFEEDAMNSLIVTMFGDSYITLNCGGGECLHFSQVPGYQRPPKPSRTVWVALSAALAGLIFILASAGLWYLGRAHSDSLGQIRLPQSEAAKLLNDHVPAGLHFSDLSYSIGSQQVLTEINGNVNPGEILAIMGASGAGKTTLLDILARKNKKGTVAGTSLVNGQIVTDDDFRKVVGFVDQEDTLMSTLTVYETVLYSALLRLPREMSIEAKKYRTLETLNELGILGIKDSRIGDSGKRSISGGEKRRVSIACELVTSPSILFLDEPTSGYTEFTLVLGLDSYNASNVIECLVTLARDYKRTVVFTIHQPRSNIVALFDKLLLLAYGRLVYSGPMIDLTMKSEEKKSVSPASTQNIILDEGPYADEERGVGLESSPALSSNAAEEAETVQAESRANVFAETASLSGRYLKHKTSLLLQVMSGPSKLNAPLSPELAALVEDYTKSDIAASLRSEMESLLNNGGGSHTGASSIVAENPLRSRQRATWVTQFRILSGRAFKNLYRNPALLAAHYISSIVIAVICSILFRDLKNDIPGFQNRLGLFFFSLALFGLSCLSSIGVFAEERLLFMRESVFPSASSKPALHDPNVDSLLFAGLLINRETLGKKLSWILITSIFHAAFEALAVNELRYLQLKENKVALFNILHWYGVEIDVPAAAVLSSFGLQAQSFWWPDISLLGIMFGVFTVASYILLHYYVAEQR